MEDKAMKTLRLAGSILLLGAAGRFLTHRFEAVFGIIGVLGALLMLPSALRTMMQELKAHAKNSPHGPSQPHPSKLEDKTGCGSNG